MITYKEWMSGTRWPLKRSDELKAVDQALQNYEKTRRDLDAVGNALDAWADAKGRLASGKIKTERNEQVVSRLINDVMAANEGLFGGWLAHDIKLARQLCDPYLKRRVVGQGLVEGDADLEKYKQGSGQSTVALLAEIQKLRKDEKSNIKPSAALKASPFESQEFWLQKGRAQESAAAGSGIWCDASAALIVHLLARNPNFKSSLHIVSQGDPKHHGHWFVVANRGENDLLQFGSYFGPADGSYNVTIDIWGAIRGNRKSSVIHPARAIYDCDHGTGKAYDHNNLKVHCRFPGKRI